MWAETGWDVHCKKRPEVQNTFRGRIPEGKKEADTANNDKIVIHRPGS